MSQRSRRRFRRKDERRPATFGRPIELIGLPCPERFADTDTDPLTDANAVREATYAAHAHTNRDARRDFFQ